MVPKYFPDAHGIFVMFDLARRQTFDSIAAGWADTVRVHWLRTRPREMRLRNGALVCADACPHARTRIQATPIGGEARCRNRVGRAGWP